MNKPKKILPTFWTGLRWSLVAILAVGGMNYIASMVPAVRRWFQFS